MPTDTVRPTFHAPSDSPLASLPMDLLYCIIGTLSATARGTIANCALVCQAWLHPARTHLFHELHVTDAKGRAFSDFLAFVTGHVHIAQHIKDLLLVAGMRSETDTGYLPALLSRLPGLRILRLRRMVIVRSTATRSDSAIDDIPPSHNAVPAAFSLDELHVLECSSKFGSLRHSVEDIVDILCLFEHVGHVSLELALETMESNVTVPLDWHPPRHVHVGSMDIYLSHDWWTTAATMLRQVIATPPGPSSLSLRCGNCWADVCASGALIREIGMDLRTLTLNFRHLLVRDRTITLQEVEANASLASSPMLEDLQLMLCMEYCNEKHSYAWHSSRLFANILSTASVAPLHSITIKLLVVEGLKDVPVHLSEDSVDWRRLDEVIGAFPALRNLDVVFLFVEAAPSRSDLVNDSLQELVRRGLRANHARGILRTKIEYDQWEIYWDYKSIYLRRPFFTI